MASQQNPFLLLLELHKPSQSLPFANYFEDDSGEEVAYLELGRRQKMRFRTADGSRRLVDQITIRNVVLAEHFRGKGYFSELVTHLLSIPEIEAVQLEAVMNPWLLGKLLCDPKWVCQNAADERDFNPSFVLFAK